LFDGSRLTFGRISIRESIGFGQPVDHIRWAVELPLVLFDIGVLSDVTFDMTRPRGDHRCCFFGLSRLFHLLASLADAVR
jgi:hypothetical protein